MSSARPPAVPCPSCAEDLPAGGVPSCPRCGLPLRGALAGRLWQIDRQLGVLAEERAALLVRMRSGGTEATAEVWAGPSAGQPAGPSAGPPARPSARKPAQSSSLSGQQLLLGLGVAALLVAAVVFLAVAWDLLGVTGQVVVMAGLTAAAVVGARAARRRGLAATGEALAALAVGLAVLDLAAARALGLAGLESVDENVYAMAAAAGLALLAGAAWWAERDLRAFGIATVVASAAVPMLAVVAFNLGPASGSVLALISAASFAAAFRALPASAARSLCPVAAVGYAALTVLAGVSAAEDGPAGAAAVGTVSVLLVAAAGVAVWLRPNLPADMRDACGVLAALITALVVTVDVAHAGPVAVTALALAGSSMIAGAAVVGSGFDQRWRLGTGATGLALAGMGLAALPVDDAETSQSVVLLGLAVALAITAVELVGLREIAAGGAGLAVLAAAGLATSGRVGARVGLLVAVALMLLAAAGARRGHREERTLAGGAVAGTLAALAIAVDSDLRMANGSLPAISGVLAVGGFAGFGYALLPDRGLAALAGVGGITGALWVAFADADVSVVEAYSMPLAVLAGILGLIRLRREPKAPSWATVGPACSAALLPSAVASVDDVTFLRAGLVLVAATLVLLAGVARRWQAPAVTSSIALGIVLISQLGPYAVGLPRWLTIGVVGAALLAVGARYERRRADVVRAAAWVGGLR